jgi:hypothetical protein
VRRPLRAVFILFLLASLYVTAADRTPAWKLTTEERLRLRFGGADQPPRARDVDGRTHPELLFPSELFAAFVRGSFVAPWAARHRTWVEQKSDDLFRSAAEWKALERIVARYAAAMREEQSVLKSLGNAAADQKPEVREKLRARTTAARLEEAHALREARKEFGRERFDRFLYTVVAPSQSISVSRDHAPDGQLRSLREREERAQ